MSCFGRLAGAPWRGPRRLGMTLRVSAADPFGQLTGASVFVGGIALVKSRSGGLGLGQRDDRRTPFARRSESNFGVSRARLTQRIGGCISPVGTGSSRLLTLPG